MSAVIYRRTFGREWPIDFGIDGLLGTAGPSMAAWEIPARETWLHKNPEALASVKRGLAQFSSGVESADLGSFTDEDRDF